jgi:WD40 repeat protein
MSREKLPETPYKGLTPYTEDDAQFFFGREAEEKIINANLMASRLTVLYGPSGVGKSSVLRAGVAYHLRRTATKPQRQGQTPEFAVVVFSSWRDNPLLGLSQSIQDALSGLSVSLPFDALSASQNLAESLKQLTVRDPAQPRPTIDLLIILDQFEEYFLYHDKKMGEDAFAEQFARIINDPQMGVNFLISIRDDALSKLDNFKGRVQNLFGNRLSIRHLDVEAARAAIVQPLAHYNEICAESEQVSIEPALVEAVLNQVRTGKVLLDQTGRGVVKHAEGDPKALTQIETPYLQLVMTRLWETEKAASSHVLRLKTLEDLGGATTIIKTHLDKVMGELSEEEQNIAAPMFHYLVTPSGTKIAHSAKDLAVYVGLKYDQIQPVLTKLVNTSDRILRPVAVPQASGVVSSEEEQSSTTRYEIFHDVLAPAILDWRFRHDRKRKDLEAEKQLRDERRKARNLSMGVIALAILLLFMMVITIYASQQRKAAVSARSELQSKNEELTKTSDALRISEGNLKANNEKLVKAQDILEGDKIELEKNKRDLTAKNIELQSAQDNLTKTNLALEKNNNELALAKQKVEKQNQDLTTKNLQLKTAEGELNMSIEILEQTNQKLKEEKARAELLKGQAETAQAAAEANAREALLARDEADREKDAAESAQLLVKETDSRTPHFQGIMRGYKSNVTIAEFSRDGKHIVTAGDDGRVLIWDTGDLYGAPKELVDPNANKVSSADTRYKNTVAAFSQDNEGSMVVGTAYDSQLRRFDALVWDSRTGNIAHTLSGHQGEITSAAFSPDGTLVVTGSTDRTARIWKLSTCSSAQAPCESITLSHRLNLLDKIKSVAFSYDGRYIATAGSDGKAQVWEVGKCISGSACEPLVEIKGHDKAINSIVFSRNQRFLLTASESGSAKIWNVSSGKKVATLFERWSFSIRNKRGLIPVTFDRKGHRRTPYTSADLSPDNEASFVVTSSDEGIVKIWDRLTGTTVQQLRGHIGRVNSVAFSPGGKYILTAGSDGTARVWDFCRKGPVEANPQANEATGRANDRFHDYCTKVANENWPHNPMSVNGQSKH